MKPHRPKCETLESRTVLSASPNAVLVWNAIALEAIRVDKTAPPVAARDLAIIQASVYDAVNSIARTGPAYDVLLRAPQMASTHGAVIGAAHEALVSLFPGQKQTFDAAFFQAVNALPANQGTTAGLALGAKVADLEVAARSIDGSTAVVSYPGSTTVGQWRPTPPANAPAVLPQWPDVRPFVLSSSTQFKTPGPPALNSPAYAAAVNDVKSLGARDSTTRTADQTQIAYFWSDGAGTATPPGHWNEIAATVAAARNDSLLKDAKVFATLDLALADAGIACWTTKYTDGFWRPITAIRDAASSGNPSITADPSWTPLLATPAFPSYVSGHSTFSAAAAMVLGAYYGPKTSFAITSDAMPGVTRSFSSFRKAADEAGMSRIYGGIHYQFDNKDGLALGMKIGRYVVHHAFRGRAPH